MNSMNCRSVQKEIEEAAPGDLLNSIANDHVESCSNCATFRQKHLKLQEIVSSLGTVPAPADFEFRLRARLASEGNRKPGRFMSQKLSFGFGSAAFVAVSVLIASALLVIGLRSPVDTNIASNESKSAALNLNAPLSQSINEQQEGVPVVTVKAPATPTIKPVQGEPIHSTVPRGFKASDGLPAVAALREPAKLKTRDLSSTTAQIVRPNDQVVDEVPAYAFPIEAPYQSLKVSLDDGRGISRTISLPTVSFGSLRSLSQNASPLLASSRGSW